MRRNKYNNHKTPCSYGHIHDSRKEAARCDFLHGLQKQGSISNLQIQVEFVILPAKKYANMPNERKLSYFADFVYTQDGLTVIEDCKGMKTDLYKAKRKLIKARFCNETTIFIET